MDGKHRGIDRHRRPLRARYTMPSKHARSAANVCSSVQAAWTGAPLAAVVNDPAELDSGRSAVAAFAI
jgi:hypothetical protein